MPACNLLAYALGALALTQPLWLCVAVAVAAVLLLGGRRTLHAWAARVPTQEVVTAGQFLVLVGVVLPLLQGRPTIPYTPITPFGVWLAVVAVSTISYASYLLQRFVFPKAERCSRPFSADCTRRPRRPSCWRAVRSTKG